MFVELERDGFYQNPFFQCLVAEVSQEHQTKEGKEMCSLCSPSNDGCQFIAFIAKKMFSATRLVNQM